MSNRRTSRWMSLLMLAALAFVLSLLLGCHGEETPVSPNATTAAPARLPGENPKSPTDKTLGPGGK